MHFKHIIQGVVDLLDTGNETVNAAVGKTSTGVTAHFEVPAPARAIVVHPV